MNLKTFTISLIISLAGYSATAQRIVVDTASTSKYLIKPANSVNEKKNEEKAEEMNFSDRAFSIGKGILNRLKARLNLEEAAETIKEKKEKILGKQEEEEAKQDDG